MTNNNNLPKTETVQELKIKNWWEEHQIKKSPLSSVSRSKVINKSGSEHVSEDRESYGPCIKNGTLNYDNCYCSSEELDRQLRIIRNKGELEILERGDTNKFRPIQQPWETNNLGIILASNGVMSTLQHEGSRGSFRCCVLKSKVGNIGEVSWTTPTNFIGLPSGDDYTDQIKINTLQQLENFLTALSCNNVWHDRQTDQVKEKVRSLVEACKRGEKVVGTYSFGRE